MITNYNACPLGLALLSRISSETQSKVLVVSHNVDDVSGSSNQVIGFAAKL
jgi:ABC-type thiamine transport system ATPase subunit